MELRARELTLRGEALAGLVARIAPGGRVVRTRRLRGGLGCRMDVLDIERADGTRWNVALRRFVRAARSSTPERVAYEFEVLRLVERAGIPAPRPILLDAQGEHFGVPAIVLSYLPGRPYFPAANVGQWTEGLAAALRAVHVVTPERFDLSWLRVQLRDGIRETLVRRREASQADPLATEAQPVLERALERIDFEAPTLVHHDYWPGNTVWHRGRLAGIIDWTDAELGDPRADVAQCRVDVTISHGIEVADGFLEGYERLFRAPLPDLWFFDLYCGATALLQYGWWLESYRDMGHQIDEANVEARLRAFLRRALAEGARR